MLAAPTPFASLAHSRSLEPQALPSRVFRTERHCPEETSPADASGRTPHAS